MRGIQAMTRTDMHSIQTAVQNYIYMNKIDEIYLSVTFLLRLFEKCCMRCELEVFS